MRALFGRPRVSVADVPVTAHALVPGPSRELPVHGRAKLLGWAAVLLFGLGAAVVYVFEFGAHGWSGADIRWALIPVVVGPPAAAAIRAWVRTNQARPQLFSVPQPVRQVEVHRSWEEVAVRPPQGRTDALIIPADVEWEKETRPATLYGDPVAGGWCAVEIDGTLIPPTGPSTVRRWTGPGSREYERDRANFERLQEDRSTLLQDAGRHLDALRRLEASAPPEQRAALADEIGKVEQQLTSLRKALKDLR